MVSLSRNHPQTRCPSCVLLSPEYGTPVVLRILALVSYALPQLLRDKPRNLFIFLVLVPPLSSPHVHRFFPFFSAQGLTRIRLALLCHTGANLQFCLSSILQRYRTITPFFYLKNRQATNKRDSLLLKEEQPLVDITMLSMLVDSISHPHQPSKYSARCA